MLLRSSGWLVLVAATAASGAEVKPTISVGIVDTDNLTLVRTDPEPATVYMVTPGVSVAHTSRRIEAAAAYRMDAYHYRERDAGEIYNVFDGELEFGLEPEKLLLDIGASRTQSIVDPEATIPTDNLALTTNRVDRDDYFFGPRIAVDLGGNAVINGEMRRTWVGYGATDVSVLDDYVYDRAELSVDNHVKRGGVAWGARYKQDKTEYKTDILPYEYRSGELELGFWARGGTLLFGIAGKETPWDQPLVTSLEDSFWEVGVTQEVGEQVQATVAVGDHSYGSSLRADVNYQFGRGFTLLSYSETPAVSTNHRYFQGGLLDPTESNDYLFSANSVERYISDALRWYFSFDLDRTDLTLNLYDEKRRLRTDIDGTPLDDETQRGGSLDVARTFGAKTEISLTLLKSNTNFGSGEQIEVVSATLGARYSLGTRTYVELLFEQREQTQASELLDYEVDLITLRLTRNFYR